MKNVFFAFAFMLIGTFAFASNAEVEIIEENVVIENVVIENVVIENVLTIEEVSLEDEMVCGFGVSWDTSEHGAGSAWFECDSGTTMGDILNVILSLFF